MSDGPHAELPGHSVSDATGVSRRPSSRAGALPAASGGSWVRFSRSPWFNPLMVTLLVGVGVIYFFMTGGGPRARLERLGEVYLTQDRWRWLLSGLGSTLVLTLIAAVTGVMIGLVLSVIRMAWRAGAPIALLNLFAETYVTVVRGTPVTVQLMIIYFGLFADLPVSRVLAAGLAFGINSGAYVAEIFRAGIESVDVGQMEAARSLGLPYLLAMRKVVLPQAFRNVLPTLVNEFITLLKETAVAGYIAVEDLTREANNIRTKTFDIGPLYVTALIYLVLVLLLTLLLRRVERKLREGDRSQVNI